MLLIEADGKALLRQFGVQIPEGHLVEASDALPELSGDGGPWVVKAQVPVGGRGKAGGVIVCRTRQEVIDATKRMLGRSIRGHSVRSCLVERVVDGAEAYLSLMVEPGQGGVKLMYSSAGGVDIEEAARRGLLRSLSGPADPASVRRMIAELVGSLPASEALLVGPVAQRMADLLFERELLLAEINPLFLTRHEAIAGDAKIAVDINAFARQPVLGALVERRANAYPDILRKLREGFDYIDLDEDGAIGLVTTGAGLSMMLVDDLVARGGKPINFCDIRTGQFRGSPDRLLRILEWLNAKRNLRVIFVNVFAGITDLGEFARLLVLALGRSTRPIPVVVRIVGTAEQEARAYLQAERPDLHVYDNMELALAKVIEMASA